MTRLEINQHRVIVSLLKIIEDIDISDYDFPQYNDDLVLAFHIRNEYDAIKKQEDDNDK